MYCSHTICVLGGDNMAKPKTKLEEIRRKNFLTQAEVAKQLSMTQSHYNKIENGLRGLSLDVAKKLKKIFGLTYIDDLLDEAG